MRFLGCLHKGFLDIFFDYQRILINFTVVKLTHYKFHLQD